MFRHGLSYVADAKQVMFTADERKTVQGVLDGKFEVGMARTDQIERHMDANGNPIDPRKYIYWRVCLFACSIADNSHRNIRSCIELFKVISPQIHVLDDGQLFPFLSSTQLHPEWPVAALDHVSRDVSLEVQEALLALRDHATSLELKQNLRCDTTPELANLASTASEAGTFVGFRTSRSYFQVRSVHKYCCNNTAVFLEQFFMNFVCGCDRLGQSSKLLDSLHRTRSRNHIVSEVKHFMKTFDAPKANIK